MPTQPEIHQDNITLDPGIKEIVEFLNENGYHTFTSCQGGKSHAFKMPTIGMQYDGEYPQFRDKLAEFLSHHFDSFTISHTTAYNKIHQITWQAVYIQFLPEVKTWRKPCSTPT